MVLEFYLFYFFHSLSFSFIIFYFFVLSFLFFKILFFFRSLFLLFSIILYYFSPLNFSSPPSLKLVRLRHALCDYALESSLLAHRAPPATMYRSLALPAHQVLQAAEDAGSASVRHIQVRTALLCGWLV